MAGAVASHRAVGHHGGALMVALNNLRLVTRLEPPTRSKKQHAGNFSAAGHRPALLWPLIIESHKLGYYVFVYKNNPYKGAIFIPKNPTNS
jgi:hypothetical protein